MKKVVKQVLGIDVSKDTLDVCLGQKQDDETTTVTSRKQFKNQEKEVYEADHLA